MGVSAWGEVPAVGVKLNFPRNLYLDLCFLLNGRKVHFFFSLWFELSPLPLASAGVFAGRLLRSPLASQVFLTLLCGLEKETEAEGLALGCAQGLMPGGLCCPCWFLWFVLTPE